MKNNKSLYKSEGINVSDYKEYDGGYKVIDFSSDKSNKYGSKNVLFDKNNKNCKKQVDNFPDSEYNNSTKREISS